MNAPPRNPAKEVPVSSSRILVVPTAANVRRITLPVSAKISALVPARIQGQLLYQGWDYQDTERGYGGLTVGGEGIEICICRRIQYSTKAY